MRQNLIFSMAGFAPLGPVELGADADNVQNRIVVGYAWTIG